MVIMNLRNGNILMITDRNFVFRGMVCSLSLKMTQHSMQFLRLSCILTVPAAWFLLSGKSEPGSRSGHRPKTGILSKVGKMLPEKSGTAATGSHAILTGLQLSGAIP